MNRTPAIFTALKFDLVVTTLGIVGGVVFFASDYRGGCPGTMDGGGGCSGIFGLIFEVIFGLVFWSFYYWWAILLILSLPLIIGFVVDHFAAGEDWKKT